MLIIFQLIQLCGASNQPAITVFTHSYSSDMAEVLKEK